ncbi:uncharacterized protein [Miscanthus floridulus]|uniref:uncharacterized protein n=1 Tax=Miscanthus floridulus TaxID=154761 RepID=UPI0034588CA5
MGQFATRLSAMEGRTSPSPAGPSSLVSPSTALPYGLPGYGGIPPLPTTDSAVVHTAAQGQQSGPPPMLPIHQIPFPHSPSPLPSFDMSLPQQQPAPYEGHADELGVPRFQKLNFPTFDGVDDPLGWLNKCDHFFRAQRTPEGDKLWLASFHMNGVAQQWYYMLERDYGDVSAVSWPLFKALCYQRFGPALATNHLSDLARLPFEGSVQRYQEVFLARLAHAEPLTPMQQVRLFTGGLPEPIRTDVELQGPTDLQRAMGLARAYERHAAALVPVAPSQPPRPPPRQQLLALLAPTSTQLQLPAPAANPTPPPRPFKRLSPTEMADCRSKGLCYNCDEPYVRGHRCQRLFYLEVTDFHDSEPPLPDEEQSPQPAVDELPPLILLSAITDIRTVDTMQVHIAIGNYELTALIDSGSTHNFISSAAARRVGLHFQDSKGAHVVVANGDRVACHGLACAVAICIGEEHFTVDCYTIPLDCYDMVLGVKYLRTLGPILWDFDDLCMAFWHNGKRVLWKGIGSMRTDTPPAGRLHAVHDAEPALLDRLLDSFSDIFESPAGLPPARPCDHRIHLLPNTVPVAVRPYRYP